MLGKQIADENELYFEKVFFTYSNFREWVNRPSIVTEFIPDGESYSEFKEIPKISGNLDDLWNYEIEFHNYGEYPKESFKISIEQGVTFNILPRDEKTLHLNDFLKMNQIVKLFFMFMQGSYIVEESINCINFEKNIRVELIQFYPQLAKPKKFDHNVKFKHTYDEIKIKFERIIQKWVEKYKEMPDFFNSYFENIINESLFPYDRFENLFQSILFYYNYKFDNKRLPKEEYSTFIKKMKGKLNEEEQKFVDRFSNLGNEFSISQQLDKVFEQLEFFKNEPQKRKRYIREIVKTRHKISHATGRITPQSLSDATNMTSNLTTFISNLILYEIEYSK
ncbi:MAG: hypothetical protein GWO15_03375 [Nitrosopumilaceae archaeon]|nr:hypothetical protein [Nitrosopumilaceae archaeon]